jgi:hypothetical protein
MVSRVIKMNQCKSPHWRNIVNHNSSNGLARYSPALPEIRLSQFHSRHYVTIINYMMIKSDELLTNAPEKSYALGARINK